MSNSREQAPEEFLPAFGLSEFRPGQSDVIQAVVAGDDCLCIMPTGGGKSLCYQLPALMRPGATLVVSPLIALMKDQVDSLTELGIRSGFINSSLTPVEQSTCLSQFADGLFDLLYVAPERFRSSRFIDAVSRANVDLLAIDEAHCISEWGHDFRHDYARLGEFREQIGSPQTIALTATATREVREDVCQQLRLETPKTFIAGFARPNLHYEVYTHAGNRDKREALRKFLSETSGAGIVYASTRKACEELGEAIAEWDNRQVVVYHGGLGAEDRREVQDEFMHAEDAIVVATNAFGMGIDKSTVRFVAHYNMPGSLEAYYQEAGRAGRDGNHSRCAFFFSPSDRYIQEFFIESAFPQPDAVAKVYDFLRCCDDNPIEMTQDEIRASVGLSISSEGVGTCERLLEKAGALERLEPNRNLAAVRLDTDAATLVDFLPSQARNQISLARAIEQRLGKRRHELVYLPPQEIAEAAGLNPAAANRAFRELNRLECFTYVPPFRGRALRMIDRETPFEELAIDFEGLAARRQSNLGKLRRVIDYATLASCRQQMILDYFGESEATACGHCDNCHSGDQEATSDAADSGAIHPGTRMIVIKLLSGVARARGRFGKQMIIGMLCGSRSAKVLKWKLDELSTFGVLSAFTQTDVSELIDAAIASGLLEQSEIDRFRPVIKLTDQGEQVVRGKAELERFRLPKSLRRKVFGGQQQPRGENLRPMPSPPMPEDRQFPEDSRDESAPKSLRLDQSSELKGPIGSSSPPTNDVAASAMIDADVKPEFFWTWRLFAVDGYSLDQAALIRRLSREEVIDHALRAVEHGLALPLEKMLSSEEFERLQEAFSGDLPSSLRGVTAKLPTGISPQLGLLFWNWRNAQTSGQSTTFEN